MIWHGEGAARRGSERERGGRRMKKAIAGQTCWPKAEIHSVAPQARVGEEAPPVLHASQIRGTRVEASGNGLGRGDG